MAIFLDKNARVVVQGATGREGAFHMQRMCDYGTTVVAGVSPGKGGSTSRGVRVFDTVAEAVARTGATHTIVVVPPAAAADALFEAFDAGISLAICITKGIPVHDMLRVVATTAPMRIVGPNCPGIISPGLALAGIMPGEVFSPGGVGVVSRSGTLTYEIVDALTKAGLGQSTCVGIGGDSILGTTFVDCLRAFSRDPRTTSVVLCGEIGGSDEEDAATYIAAFLPRLPIVAFIGGRSASPCGRSGHAGAISGTSGTPEGKLATFARANVPVADRPSDIPALLRERIDALALRG